MLSVTVAAQPLRVRTAREHVRAARILKYAFGNILEYTEPLLDTVEFLRLLAVSPDGGAAGGPAGGAGGGMLPLLLLAGGTAGGGTGRGGVTGTMGG
jgi:hypothetical protein